MRFNEQASQSNRHASACQFDDLLATLEVSMPDAILGATTTIESLDGPVDLELRPADLATLTGAGFFAIGERR